MNWFFIDNADIDGASAVIRGDDVKHITGVLRMGVGDTLCVCNGEGSQYEARIVEASKRELRLELGSAMICDNEPERSITLIQGVPKAQKLETVVQKCVELGITRIIPFCAERSVVKSDKAGFESRRTRAARIAYEAAKQSRRGIIPQVAALSRLDEIDYTQFELLIVADEEERELTLKSALREYGRTAHKLAFVVGPEGGLERSEVEYLKSQGGVAVTLGKRILRTETAGMAVLAMMLYELES